MKMKELRRDYKKLTTQERFSLKMAAISRHDQAELDALRAASPSRLWWLNDTFGLSLAFALLAPGYLLEQARCLLRLSCVLRVGELAESQEDDEACGRAAWKELRCLLVNWVSFLTICSDYGVDADALLARLPASDLVELIEAALMRTPERLRKNVSGIDEAVDALRSEIKRLQLECQ